MATYHVIVEKYEDYIIRKTKEFKGSLTVIGCVLKALIESLVILTPVIVGLDFLFHFLPSNINKNVLMIWILIFAVWMWIRFIFLLNDKVFHKKSITIFKELLLFLIYSLFVLVLIVSIVAAIINGETMQQLKNAIIIIIILLGIGIYVLSKNLTVKFIYHRLRKR